MADSQEHRDDRRENRKHYKQLQRSRGTHSAAIAYVRDFSISAISRTHFPQHGCAAAVRSKISRTVRHPCAQAAWISLDRIPWQLQTNIARRSDSKCREANVNANANELQYLFEAILTRWDSVIISKTKRPRRCRRGLARGRAIRLP
jgi:hypothetical protein